VNISQNSNVMHYSLHNLFPVPWVHAWDDGIRII